VKPSSIMAGEAEHKLNYLKTLYPLTISFDK